MANILSSWKEISQYLGRGVRTVQRWEREAGLPVRRQATPIASAVIAMPDELDAWARSRGRAPSAAAVGALQREIAALHAENEEFRARLEVLEAAFSAMASTEVQPASFPHRPAKRRQREQRR